jgi:hypothetical protein
VTVVVWQFLVSLLWRGISVYSWNWPGARRIWGSGRAFSATLHASSSSCQPAFGLTGTNLVVGDSVVKFVNVKAKNWQFGYPVPFSFPLEDRPYCVGRFVVEYLKRFGIKVGNASHFIACKVMTKRGGTSVALPLVQVSVQTMFASNKAMIKRIGLDPTCFGSYSAKRGGALAAAEAGFSEADLLVAGNWKLPEMAAQYIRGLEAYRNGLLDMIRT